jgi:hypothetical protein
VYPIKLLLWVGIADKKTPLFSLSTIKQPATKAVVADRKMVLNGTMVQQTVWVSAGPMIHAIRLLRGISTL